MKKKDEYRNLATSFLIDLNKIWQKKFTSIKTNEEKLTTIREYLSAIETLILIAVRDPVMQEILLRDLDTLIRKKKDKEKNKNLN